MTRSYADDLVAAVKAAHELHLPQTDEDSPSARKLVRLIEVAERCLHYPMPLTMRQALVAAIDEARQP